MFFQAHLQPCETIYTTLDQSRIGGILARIEKSVEINVPPEKIWPIIKWENVPQWFETVKKVEWTSKEQNTVGSTFHVIQEAAGAKMEAEITRIW